MDFLAFLDDLQERLSGEFVEGTKVPEIIPTLSRIFEFVTEIHLSLAYKLLHLIGDKSPEEEQEVFYVKEDLFREMDKAAFLVEDSLIGYVLTAPYFLKLKLTEEQLITLTSFLYKPEGS